MNKQDKEKDIVKELLWKNEISTNKVICQILVFNTILLTVVIMLYEFELIKTELLEAKGCLIGVAVAMAAIAAAGLLANCDKRWIRHFLLPSAVVTSGFAYFWLYDYAIFFIACPILISTRYYHRKFTIQIGLLSWIIYITTSVLNVYLQQSNTAIHYFHWYNDINIWSTWQSAILEDMLPRTGFLIMFLYCAINIEDNGRKFFIQHATNMKRVHTMHNEFNTASQIQKSVLAEMNFATNNGEYAICASMHPAKEVAGDFYDYFMADENTLVVMVGDVSDKGLPAAMFMMSVKSLLRISLQYSPDFEKAFVMVNNILANNNASFMYVTLWAAYVDIRTGIGRYVNAGHPCPIIRHSNGAIEYLDNAPDTFLGVFEDKHPKAHLFKMEKDDTLIIYTDGATDAENSKKEMFGNERLIMEAARCNNSADEICKHLEEVTESFSGNMHLHDDITFLVLHQNIEAYQPEYKSIRTKVDIESIGTITELINRELTLMECPDIYRRDVDTAIDEITINIVDYAFAGKEDNGNEIEIQYALQPNCITMKFIDAGIPFNPLSVVNPTFSSNPTIGGLGIYLTKQITDDIHYERKDDKNVLTFTKTWRKDPRLA